MRQENQANGIGDCKELLISSIGFSLTGKDDARAVVQVPLGSVCSARAAAESWGGCTEGRGDIGELHLHQEDTQLLPTGCSEKSNPKGF